VSGSTLIIEAEIGLRPDEIVGRIELAYIRISYKYRSKGGDAVYARSYRTVWRFYSYQTSEW